MVGKWYPERKGGKTGFVNGGFAYGSVPFIFLFTSYLDVANYQGLLFAVGVFLAALVAVSGFFFKDPPKNWWPPHVDPLKVNDDPTIRRALLKNPPAVKQYTPMEAIKTGILPLMWFVLLCTAGINIFGIAMQVPFGKEMGFAGGIVATRDEPQGHHQRHRPRRDRLDLRPVRAAEHAHHRVRGAGAVPVRGVLVRLHRQHAAVPVGVDGLRISAAARSSRCSRR